MIRQLRQNRIGRGRHHPVVPRQQAGTKEERCQNRYHRAEGSRRVFLGGLLECHYSIRDGLGSRHRGASFGESPNEQVSERETS